MPAVVEEKSFDGAKDRLSRLGLGPVFQELRQAIEGFELRLREARDANSAAAVREMIDARLAGLQGWIKGKQGQIDWSKCISINGATVCLGVEIQVSARSDLLIRDVVHLRNALIDGSIDIGIIVVPSDRTAVFMTDRCPNFSTAVSQVHDARAEDHPLMVLAIDHEGPGEALPTKKTR